MIHFIKTVTVIALLLCFAFRAPWVYAPEGRRSRRPTKRKFIIDNPPKEDRKPREDNKGRDNDKRNDDDKRKPPFASYLRQLVG
jgi:cbb3-type cytochrome oxidase subunit 3